MAVAAVGVGWLGYAHTGERGRLATCQRNLAVLSGAMHSFADDHEDCLPFALLEGKPNRTWDMLLEPYLQPGLKPSLKPKPSGSNAPPKAAKSYYAERQARRAEKQRAEKQGAQVKKQAGKAVRQVVQGQDSCFLCPSDFIVRERPRSYAMSEHFMSADNWPPGPDNRAGVGVEWTKNVVTSLLGNEAWEDVVNDRQTLGLVKFSDMRAPADTLVLTELVDQGNRLQSVRDVTIRGVTGQWPATNAPGARIHRGRFNYLMADGHVEALTPYQTGRCGTDAGIWTVYDGD